MKKIALLGHGVVGSGVMEILERNSALLERQAGEQVEAKYILDRRDFSALPYGDRFTTSFDAIREDPEVAVVVEALGGVEPAYGWARASLLAGKSFVTSNKELVATKGDELLALAAEKGVHFLFEASVGGGIPVLQPLRESLTANHITGIAGILNGTTNFILTRMFQEGMAFADALALAQELGYAEQDPTADVGGFDACRKICILASIAFGSRFDPEKVPTRGITAISARDVACAARWGGAIKLIGRAGRAPDGRVDLEVAPMLVPNDCLLAGVGGVYNAVQVTGDMVGNTLFYGPGAGKLPTASAVVGDVVTALTQPANSRPVPWGPEKPELLRPWEESPARALLRVAGMDRQDLAAFFPDCQLLEPAEEGEEALVTALSTQGELDAAQSAAEAAGARVLSRITVLEEMGARA